MSRRLRRFERLSNVELRVYGHNGRRCNLNFLEHFPFLRRFAIEAHKLDGLDGLQNLSPKLQSLKMVRWRLKSIN